ncbi:FtsX-like permease family protein [Breoghania sp. JC706]|uniref:ABC transporter permease n=1 Tax=Breoghania sp. JC706 TaxID=3117732 RepID=UPI00300980BA
MSGPRLSRLGLLSPLDRKLLRDLGHMKGQVFAIAVVIATGVGVLVMSLGNIQSLRATADAYYERYRFADVFAQVKRAPIRLADRIRAIPGVQTVEPRIVRYATLDMPGFTEPVTGLLSSLPGGGQPLLNRLAITEGRLPDPATPEEAVVNARFAEAHALHPGSRFKALINTQKRSLRVVGVALSPEHSYAIGPGMLMPDKARYGIVWMGEKSLAGAFDLDDAFNDVSLSLLPGTDPETVIARLDLLTERYGGTGAYARKDQQSNWFLMSEIDQLGTMAVVLPSIFLAVAAFLTNMVIDRLIATERGIIGLLKAFGYSHLEIGWHYVKFVVLITGAGIGLGAGLGIMLGRYNAALYADFYAFPFLVFRPEPDSFLIAGGASLAAALIGTAFAVMRAARLAPAEAMRPPAPPSFGRSALARSRLALLLDQPTRMIVRQVLRWPLRSGLTVLGIAMSVAVLIIALQWEDSVSEIMEIEFKISQRQDATVSLAEVRGRRVRESFAAMPGVLAVEGERSIAVRARNGPRSKRIAVTGLDPDASLHRLFDTANRPVPLPPEGLVISTKLGEMLGVGVGDAVELEVLEGRRPTVSVPVVATFETYFGYPAYMRLEALNRLMRDAPVVGALQILLDPRHEAALFAALKETPAVAFVTLRRAAIDMFQETMAETVSIFTGIFSAFAASLAMGVVYNSAHISLSERARELSTLRVIGFTRFEISYILIGQSLLLTVIALPVGCVIGTWLAHLMTAAFDTELYRIPAVIEPSTYGYSSLLVLASALVSAMLVRRRLDRLDLVAVLKTRE